jgi:hypothetical protein
MHQLKKGFYKARSTFNVQRSTFNVQRSTFNVQRSTFNAQRSTQGERDGCAFEVESWMLSVERFPKKLLQGVPHFKPLLYSDRFRLPFTTFSKRFLRIKKEYYEHIDCSWL